MFVGGCLKAAIIKKWSILKYSILLVKGKKQNKSFRKSLVPSRLPGALPHQDYISTKCWWEIISDKLSCLEEKKQRMMELPGHSPTC